MSFFESVPSPKLADETIGAQQEGNLAETRIPLPMVESEHFSPEFESAYPCPNEAKSGRMDAAAKIASAISANSGLRNLKHIETGSDVTTMPADQVSAPSVKSSKERFRVRPKGIIIAMMLGLATGAAIGGAWSSSQSFTENLKAIQLRGVFETVFAGSSKAEQSAQHLKTAPDATATKLNEITEQLVVLAADLSSMQENIQALATGQEQIRKSQEQFALTQSTGQEQIRKAQEQLAQAQSRLATLQAQTNLKQTPQPAPHVPDSRRFNRRDVYYYPVR